MEQTDMNIVSMERTPKEKAAAQKSMEGMMAESGPDYPYGLCLSLGKDELKKLGIDELPAVGDEFHLYAVAMVTGVRQSQNSDGDDSKNVELQITHMGAMHEDEEEDDESEDSGSNMRRAAVKLYGKAEKAEGEKA